ncbi:hypothetical protein EJ08DRAFT_79643 [Tothia fuscella]|uniref:F-box domain-containing protein n=1 Tax=Tothia fuscella TaxID=1048955 RepID=A0A9P4NXF4_9PEZI|nr:hypothetical protein EJ08DRAFT_79643 [Tothia fuscella]
MSSVRPRTRRSVSEIVYPTRFDFADDCVRNCELGDSPTTPSPLLITPPLPARKAIELPGEIIQDIYSYLPPKDFNSARHTCHSWMTASLDKNLLITMLKRGGWFSGVARYLTRALTISDPKKFTDTSVWLLSCRIARECALGSGWTGNGLQPYRSDIASAVSYTLSSSGTVNITQISTTEPQSKALVLAAKLDFSDLATGYSGTDGRQSGGLIFTVSVCGKYLLVAEGGLIYVYQLQGNKLQPLTSVFCPRRVIAMSMDASSRRFAIAALLDGRMGLMCDLQIRKDRATTIPSKRKDKAVNSTAGSFGDLKIVNFSPETRPLEEDLATLIPLESNYARSLAVPDPTEFHAVTQSVVDPVELCHGDQKTTLHDTDNGTDRGTDPWRSAWKLRLPSYSASSNDNDYRVMKSSIPVESGPRSLYRHLCSEDDPPRSVAICPQRHCVAFGCSAGLELHWVDALTGQDLNRWFPLTGPSDHLYFLPPCIGMDSPRKLRLISSASHPSQRSAISRRFSTTRPMISTFWDSVVGSEPYRVPSRAGFVSNCDHYRAVPMSDGYHILFTDPESGMLCLGSDAPLGDPRRLLRKILFKSLREGVSPRIYAAGADLMNGPRIVAAFEDQLVLYSLPSDVFELSTKEQQSKATTAEDLEQASQWLDWWPESDFPSSSSSKPEFDNPKSVWPLLIGGTIIGELSNLVDIAVNDVSGLSIWAFSVDGKASVWQINKGITDQRIQYKNIAKDGRVVDVHEIEIDGDVVMMDADTLDWAAGFDGPSSPEVRRVPGDEEFVDEGFGEGTANESGDLEVEMTPPRFWLDEDGDVVMVDVDTDAEGGGVVLGY